MADPEWLEAARKNGLTITGHGVNLDALAGSVPARAPGVTPASVGSIAMLKAKVGLAATEFAFQDAVMDFAKSLGWRRAHFRPARVVRRGEEKYETPIGYEGLGFPDTEIVRERLVKVEFKRGRNKPSPEQLAWLAAYEAAGVENYIWYPKDVEQIIEVLTCFRPAKPRSE